MRIPIALLLLVLSLFCPVFAQNQSDAATRQDIEDLMQLTGMRENMQKMYSALAGQMAVSAADSYQQRHPNATPAELQKVEAAATEIAQQTMKSMPVDEVIEAIIPIYRQHLTHSDIKAINEFYSTPTGQKLLKDSPAMMTESMQAAQAIVKKHLPEIEAQAEKAAQDAAKPDSAQPK
jgi:hypothetical protein